MNSEQRTIQRHNRLDMETCRLRGVHQPFAPHSHPYYVIGWVEKGGRKLQLDGREYRIGPGAMLVFSPGIAHGCQPDGKTGFDYRCFHLQAEALQQLLPEQTSSAPLVFTAEPFANPRLFNVFCDSHRRLEKGDAAAGLDALRDGLETLVQVSAGNDPKPIKTDAAANDGCETRLVEKIALWLESRYADRISLDDMAAVAGVDKYWLVRAFVRVRGITPYRHLESLRVGKARDMLASGAAIVDAALAAGFADQSHFNRHFKRQTGLTPAQYRRAVAKTAS